MKKRKKENLFRFLIDLVVEWPFSPPALSHVSVYSVHAIKSFSSTVGQEVETLDMYF